MNPAVSFKNVSKGYRRGADVVPVLESLNLGLMPSLRAATVPVTGALRAS